MISNVTKILEKTWKCTVGKNFKVVLTTFFPCQVVTKWPLIRYLQLKTENCSLYTLKYFQKTSFCIIITQDIQTFITKNFRNFPVFLFSVYRLHGVVIGGNFTPIGEYSSTVKNRRNRVTVLRSVGAKELINCALWLEQVVFTGLVSIWIYVVYPKKYSNY
jgi:hypothetical protein